MHNIYESLKVFISSPKDVNNEREIVEKVLKKISITCRDTLGIQVESVSWEDFVPESTKLPDEKIQDKLNSEIPKCQIFILILWQRYGSSEPGLKKSNTERETEIALDLLKKEKKLMFLTYFRNLSEKEDKGPQRKSVEKFRDSLRSQGVWFKCYDSAQEFEEILTHDLYRTIIKHRLSTNKHVALSKFWLFGTPNRPTYPNLVVIYPSMERSFMGPIDDPDVWLNRLEPNLVFEDFKALQKIEKTLRLIGYRDFRIFNTANIPNDINFMNRFWICLPRNPKAINQLKRYESKSLFKMIPRRNRKDSYILWRANLADEPFPVHSPLSQYLEEQRNNMDIKGNWKFELDRIIAKDYAVLGRFRDTENSMPMDDSDLFDYFLSGIRGLGTWGAAWFVDRKYQIFEKADDKDNIQYLLEIEYRDGRIMDVTDVSNMPQSYFIEQNKISTIRQNINRFRIENGRQ